MNKRSIPDDGPFRGRSTHQALSQLRMRARANAAHGLRRPAVAVALALTVCAVAAAGVIAMTWNGTSEIEAVASASSPTSTPPAAQPVILVSQRMEGDPDNQNVGKPDDLNVGQADNLNVGQSENRQERGSPRNAGEELSPLGAADPRWSDEQLPNQELAPEKLRALAKTYDAAAPTAQEKTALSALRSLTGSQDEPHADSGVIAYSSRDEQEPVVEIAETEAEAAALEEKLEMASSEIDTAQTASIPAAGLSPATVTRWVNMRAGPADEAEILMVVPANADVEAESDCNWCAVAYEDKRGFIYKSFIRHEDKATETD
ncbi:SH3 domain-containing protein [Mesorhizobium xinjiangense]|uniref:SH3 domain-containing protein n=1 Tax=Mesorhizobium xinjiangense TaxID=2678685 RepID=UPI0012ED1AE3|nr:SH3 domain-containing protein [Mesorhizobium xinjiangense]